MKWKTCGSDNLVINSVDTLFITVASQTEQTSDFEPSLKSRQTNRLSHRARRTKTATCIRGQFQNGLRIFKCLWEKKQQIVIPVNKAAESSGSSSGSYKWVDVRCMSGLSHGNEREQESGSWKRRGLIIGLSGQLCSEHCFNCGRGPGGWNRKVAKTVKYNSLFRFHHGLMTFNKQILSLKLENKDSCFNES